MQNFKGMINYYYNTSTIEQKTLAGENIGEFGKLMANRKVFSLNFTELLISIFIWKRLFSLPNNLNS